MALDSLGVPSFHQGRIKAFAAMMGTPPSSTHRWLSGNGLPDVDVLYRMACVLNRTLDFLTGREIIPTRRKISKTDTDFPMVSIPFLDRTNSDVLLPDFVFSNMGAPVDSIGALIIDGDEMDGFAQPNDCVFCDLSARALATGFVFAFKWRNHFFIRRVHLRTNSQIDLLCDNSRYSTETINPSSFGDQNSDDMPDSIQIIGKVVGRLGPIH